MSAAAFESSIETTNINGNLHFKENDDCTICMGENTGEALKVKCGHIFHDACIKPWLAKQATCPLCREDLSEPYKFENIHILYAAGATVAASIAGKVTGATISMIGDYISSESSKGLYLAGALAGAFALKTMYDLGSSYFTTRPEEA
ncbi:MAG: hypothetical protein S4CHLAM37_16950 [Chlamydiia bacterium]|nr:hypothetical protein [Chlamydiia bacterium]